MKKCSEEFKNLSEKKKQKLEARHAALMEEYNDQMSKYQLRHPELQKGGKKKSQNKGKMTSPFSFYWAERSKSLGKAESGNFMKFKKKCAVCADFLYKCAQ